MRLTPAEHVIRTIGGVRKTARAIGRTPPTISAWRRSRKEGGTGGDVPNRAHKPILVYARKAKLDISAEDLIMGREVTDKQRRA
jgi:hypothetical protein